MNYTFLSEYIADIAICYYLYLLSDGIIVRLIISCYWYQYVFVFNFCTNYFWLIELSCLNWSFFYECRLLQGTGYWIFDATIGWTYWIFLFCLIFVFLQLVAIFSTTLAKPSLIIFYRTVDIEHFVWVWRMWKSGMFVCPMQVSVGIRLICVRCLAKCCTCVNARDLW
jgi:hypothetical protein